MRQTLLLLSTLLLMTSAPVHAQADCLPGYGALDAGGNCVAESSLHAEIRYPAWTAARFSTRFYIEGLMRSLERDFLPNARDGFDFGRRELAVDFVEFAHSDAVRSIVFTINPHAGPAYLRAFTFDLAAFEAVTPYDVITLYDLIPDDIPATLRPYAHAQLDNPALIGDARDPNSYANFALTPGSLRLFFPAQNIDGVAAGSRTVDVPLADLGIALANAPPTPPADMEQPCVHEWAAFDGETCALSTSVEVSSRYPAVFLIAETPRTDLVAHLDARRREFMPTTLDLFCPWYFVAWADAYAYNADIRTLSLRWDVFQCGAHGTDYLDMRTYNFATDERVAFLDLFHADADPMAVLAPKIEAVFATDDDTILWTLWGGRAGGRNPRHYRNFALTDDALVFYFPPARMGPMHAGMAVIEVPLAEVAHIFALE